MTVFTGQPRSVASRGQRTKSSRMAAPPVVKPSTVSGPVALASVKDAKREGGAQHSRPNAAVRIPWSRIPRREQADGPSATVELQICLSSSAEGLKHTFRRLGRQIVVAHVGLVVIRTLENSEKPVEGAVITALGCAQR